MSWPHVYRCPWRLQGPSYGVPSTESGDSAEDGEEGGDARSWELTSSEKRLPSPTVQTVP